MDTRHLHQLLSPVEVDRLVENWLLEDSSAFDIGGLIAGGDRRGSAKLLFKEKTPSVLAGVPFVNAVFRRLNCNVQWMEGYHDGVVLSSQTPMIIAQVNGPIAALLRGERPALNCLTRASGIATGVRAAVDLAKSHDWNGRIACTRKTTPGFRIVEKYAVLVGGGDPHRYDLTNGMIMLKDNHITACGNDVEKAITKARSIASFAVKIEVEARNLDEALNAAKYGADVVMLDNFNPEQAKTAAGLTKNQWPSAVVEASGGVSMRNLSAYFDRNIDVISMGNLTQGYACVDFSLKLVSAADNVGDNDD